MLNSPVSAIYEVMSVYAGTYLGIDVAIKEVLPSTDYDVAKYFEREWRLMKSATMNYSTCGDTHCFL